VQRFTPFNLGAVPILSAVAAKSDGGERVFIAIVNKSLESPTEVRILGFKAKRATAWCLSGPSVDAANESDPDLVRPKRLDEILVGRGEISLTLPPHSFTIVVAE